MSKNPFFLVPMVAAFAWFVRLSPALAATGPLIGGVEPTTATVGQPVTLTATVSPASGITFCELYVDLADAGAMTVSNGIASASYTFAAGGSRIAFVYCQNADGGIAAGPNTAIWVNGSLQTQAPLGGSSGSSPQTPSQSSSSTSTEPGAPADGAW